MNEPKAQKNSGEFLLFGVEEKGEKGDDEKKFCRIFVVRPSFTDVVMLHSLHFSRDLCDHPSFMHPLEPFSGCIRLVHMLGFPLHVHLYAPLGPPPPGAVPAPSETTTTMTIDYWRGYEQGRVGGS